jgi:hypothetical protein
VNLAIINVLPFPGSMAVAHCLLSSRVFAEKLDKVEGMIRHWFSLLLLIYDSVTFKDITRFLIGLCGCRSDYEFVLRGDGHV